MKIAITTTTDLSPGDLIDALFAPENFDAGIAKDLQDRLSRVILPWTKNGNIPADYVRRTGTGVVIGTVSARLGEYTNPHHPERHGWGYKVKDPKGSQCDSGIVQVRTPREGAFCDDLQGAIASALGSAQDEVDLFITTTLTGYTLL